MTEIDSALARDAYARGLDGLAIAETLIKIHISAVTAVHQARATNPTAFPTYGDATPEETARRILADLLDAGWRPPDLECLTLPQT